MENEIKTSRQCDDCEKRVKICVVDRKFGNLVGFMEAPCGRLNEKNFLIFFY